MFLDIDLPYEELKKFYENGKYIPPGMTELQQEFLQYGTVVTIKHHIEVWIDDYEACYDKDFAACRWMLFEDCTNPLN